MSGERWKFEVTENGQWVAGGECSDQDRALAEAAHYARVYGQDGGDVRALVWTGRKPVALPDRYPRPRKPYKTAENRASI